MTERREEKREGDRTTKRKQGLNVCATLPSASRRCCCCLCFHCLGVVRSRVPMLSLYLYALPTAHSSIFSDVPRSIVSGEDPGLRCRDARLLRALLGVDHAGLCLLYAYIHTYVLTNKRRSASNSTGTRHTRTWMRSASCGVTSMIAGCSRSFVAASCTRDARLSPIGPGLMFEGKFSEGSSQ